MERNKDESDAFEAKVAALLSGFRERLPRSEDKLIVHGVRMTVAGVHDRLEAIGRAREAVRKAKAHYEEAVRALRATEEADQEFHDDLVRYLRRQFGRDVTRLRPFGLER
jgi:hypothetical protein